MIPWKFEWQDEYIAVSVSESQLEKVRNYIKNQEEHHKQKTFQEEFNLFIKKNMVLKYWAEARIEVVEYKPRSKDRGYELNL